MKILILKSVMRLKLGFSIFSKFHSLLKNTMVDVPIEFQTINDFLKKTMMSKVSV